MPGCSGEPVVTTLVCITKKFAREAAGALGARHSPRPHGRKDLQNSGALCRGNNFRRPGKAKREPGSITTDADDTSGWSPNPFHNPHLGLWVPAFALGHAHIWCGGLTQAKAGDSRIGNLCDFYCGTLVWMRCRHVVT